MKTFRAPGKAILCGEYAVLEGGRAISTAVDRFVSARAGSGESSGPFVAAARRAVEALVGQPVTAPLAIDSSELYVGARKIGLGSSAAVTTVAAAALLDAAGVATPSRETLYRLVEAAHAEAQGEAGSGVDVATAIAGGTIAFTRAPLAIESVVLPPELQLTFVDIGQSASTAQLVGMVRRCKAQDAAKYDAAIATIRDVADGFAAAVRASDAAGVVVAARRAHDAMASLGRLADAPIVTPPFERLAALALEHHAASKPSGAGGGDLAVLFSVGEHETATLRAALAANSFSVLTLDANAPGVDVEQR